MADNVVLSAGTADGVTLATDDVGGVHYQIVKVSFGALDTATAVSGANPLPVVQTGALPAGANAIGKLAANSGVDIGDVDVTSVPTDPFGANADAASATGSISAKLRFIAGTGIPITGNVTVVNAGTFAVQAAQSGTWTVQPGNTANTTAWLVNDAGGTVSSANSSTATLLAAATFTGTAVDISGYASVSVSVIASHASATDGLSMQQSSDGTNWDIVDTYTVPATTGKVFGVQAAAQFFRLVYTNGGTNQTSFRIQTVLKKFMPNASSVRPQDARTNENDMQEVIAYSALFNGTTWDRMRGDTTNGLDVDVTRVPTDPFGANADAASATGSISAKLRFIAATGIPITGNPAVNLAQIAATTTATGNGTASAGCQRVTVASDNTAFSVNATIKPATSGGLSVATGSITATATAIKASAGQVYGWYFYNPNASVAYVQFFNTAAASVTLGTTSPVYSLGIPATSGANVMLETGIAHSTAIAIGVTTTRAGSTSPGSSVDYNIFYN